MGFLQWLGRRRSRRWRVCALGCSAPPRKLFVLACLLTSGIAFFLALSSRSEAQTNISTLSDRSVELPASQGRLIHFDQAVESVFVGDPGVADVRVVSPDVVYVYGKKTGVTNLMAISADQKLRTSLRLNVINDVGPSNQARREVQPDSTIQISFFGNRTVVTGHARNIDDAVDAASIGQTYSPPDQPPINDTTIAGSQQVNIRVRFAEVSRDELLAIGFDWQFFASGSFQFGNSFSSSVGNVDINVLISALQRSGVLTILAEPNLTAVTGQTASFLAGGEIPIPVPQTGSGGGYGAITVEYKPFGVSLQFVPTIIKDNRIALRVRPEVSALSPAGAVKISGVEIPALIVRRADTTVEMASGQTFAIAGLFQRNIGQSVNQIPAIGEVPVLGALFSSERFKRDETELVILITPYLVKPMRERIAKTPLDRPDVPGPGPAAMVKPKSSSGLIFK